MKVVATRDMRFGMVNLAEGEEIELPEDFAKRLIAAGHATEAGGAATAEETPKKKATYKTRQVKAEK
jgi:hypothetical protein